MRIRNLLLIVALAASFNTMNVFAAAEPQSSTTTSNSPVYSSPWSGLFYFSRMTNDHLMDIISLTNLSNSFTNSFLYSGELGYELAPNNFFRHFLDPIVSTVQIAGNITYQDQRDPHKNIWEFVPMLWLRWNNFPWNKWVITSVGFAEGISYVTSIPEIEIDPNYPDGARHLLNYLGFELTFALPSYPQLELVGRVHHRSGVFGLYSGSNTGSTAVGLGIRYHF